MYAETAIKVQHRRLRIVEMCVTNAKRSKVGVLKLPYIRRELWWQTNAKEITPIASKIPG